jgi:hypothetical protein
LNKLPRTPVIASTDKPLKVEVTIVDNNGCLCRSSRRIDPPSRRYRLFAETN